VHAAPIVVKVEPPLVDIFWLTPPTMMRFSSLGATQIALLYQP
jgi:hypothetical protein